MLIATGALIYVKKCSFDYYVLMYTLINYVNLLETHCFDINVRRCSTVRGNGRKWNHNMNLVLLIGMPLL